MSREISQYLLCISVTSDLEKKGTLMAQKLATEAEWASVSPFPRLRTHCQIVRPPPQHLPSDYLLGVT